MTKSKWIRACLGLAAGATLLSSGGCAHNWWLPASLVATVVVAYLAGTLYNPNP